MCPWTTAPPPLRGNPNVNGNSSAFTITDDRDPGGLFLHCPGNSLSVGPIRAATVVAAARISTVARCCRETGSVTTPTCARVGDAVGHESRRKADVGEARSRACVARHRTPTRSISQRVRVPVELLNPHPVPGCTLRSTPIGAFSGNIPSASASTDLASLVDLGRRHILAPQLGGQLVPQVSVLLHPQQFGAGSQGSVMAIGPGLSAPEHVQRCDRSDPIRRPAPSGHPSQSGTGVSTEGAPGRRRVAPGKITREIDNDLFAAMRRSSKAPGPACPATRSSPLETPES